MKDDAFYVIQVLEEIARLEKFTLAGKEDFYASELTQYAVLRSLQNLGESVKRISEAVQTEYADVAWRGIAGLRNVLVHDYLDIDLEEIWNIVKLDVPLLKRQMQTMLPALRKE